MLLYKYFPCERGSFLRELLIRFTPPGLLNDPFDSLPSFGGFDEKFIREKVDKAGLDLALQFALEDIPEAARRRKLSVIQKANDILFEHYMSDPSMLQEYFQIIHRKRVNKDIGIFCLSETPKSILMWSHYADEHSGFVLGFDSEDPFFHHHQDEQEDIGRLFRVNYGEERAFIDVTTIRDGINLPDIFFTKNCEWDYEQEWRIIRLLKGATETRSDNIHLFKVPPTAIREVIFGCKIQPHTVDDLLNSIKTNPDLSHVAFFDAALSRTKFEMDILPKCVR